MSSTSRCTTSRRSSRPSPKASTSTGCSAGCTALPRAADTSGWQHEPARCSCSPRAWGRVGAGGSGAARRRLRRRRGRGSVTSWIQLRRDGLECDMQAFLHPDQERRILYVAAQLSAHPGPVLAVSDYMRAVQDQIRPWVPSPYVSLGADGFGFSDTRAAARRFFHIDGPSIAVRRCRRWPTRAACRPRPRVGGGREVPAARCHGRGRPPPRAAMPEGSGSPTGSGAPGGSTAPGGSDGPAWLGPRVVRRPRLARAPRVVRRPRLASPRVVRRPRLASTAARGRSTLPMASQTRTRSRHSTPRPTGCADACRSGARSRRADAPRRGA